MTCTRDPVVAPANPPPGPWSKSWRADDVLTGDQPPGSDPRLVALAIAQLEVRTLVLQQRGPSLAFHGRPKVESRR
jgi:hypothetical protein